MLDWSQGEAAKRADIGESTVRRFERDDSKADSATVRALTAAYEAAGLEIIGYRAGSTGRGVGVRFRK
jgi:transcriptional regulator with XRE-family HTH domain